MCVVCLKKNYIYAYIYLKILKRQSWSQTVQWVSTQWICMKESGDQWMRPSLDFVNMFFNKGSWHGVFKLLRFSNQPSQPELNKSDTSVMPKWLVPSGTSLREYWHSSWFLKLLIKLNLYTYFVNLWWLLTRILEVLTFHALVIITVFKWFLSPWKECLAFFLLCLQFKWIWILSLWLGVGKILK